MKTLELILFIALVYVAVDPKEFGSTIGTAFHQIEIGFWEGYQP